MLNSNRLKESRILQRGDTGFGLLIENDAGYIDHSLNKDLYHKLITEGLQLKEGEPVLINCILQKWGVKNKNGRIYPKDVLLAEVDRYMELVETNSAISEADHPECVSSLSSMIYAKNGWINISDISDNEEIYTLNTITNTIELQKIEKNIQKQYNGIMYEFKSKNSIDLTVTPNHRILLEDHKNNRFYLTAKEIYEDVGGVYSSGKYKILKRGEWIGEYQEYFTLKGLPSEYFNSDIKIKSEDWYSFLGIYLSEGHSTGIKSEKYLKGYLVNITEKKKEVQEKIEKLLSSMPFEWSKCFRSKDDTTIDYIIHDPRLYEYLFKLGSSSEKYIPTEIKQASPNLLKLLFDWFKMGDGRKVKTKYNTYKESVFSTSKQLIYDLHDVLTKIGGYGTISELQPKDHILFDKNMEIDNGDGTISIIKTKSLVKGSNCKLQYNLNISQTKHIWLDKRNIKITPIEYDGMVSCVRVPNQNFYVMKNGKAHWTGNSSVVSLQNVAHVIRKMWWGTGDNHNVLYGTLEIITSPAYMKTGYVCMIGDKICEYLKRKIRLGISSRGVGSLKEVNGENIVQKDFELICFDLVASPSTPGAYLFPESDTVMGESKEKKETLLTEKHIKIMSKMDRFL